MGEEQCPRGSLLLDTFDCSSMFRGCVVHARLQVPSYNQCLLVPCRVLLTSGLYCVGAASEKASSQHTVFQQGWNVTEHLSHHHARQAKDEILTQVCHSHCKAVWNWTLAGKFDARQQAAWPFPSATKFWFKTHCSDIFWTARKRLMSTWQN